MVWSGASEALVFPLKHNLIFVQRNGVSAVFCILSLLLTEYALFACDALEALLPVRWSDVRPGCAIVFRFLVASSSNSLSLLLI